MAEHWCKDHQQVFFKKGAMKGYAHPILDEEGEKTGEWCNEPKDETKPDTKEQSRYKGRDAESYAIERRSIERQVSVKLACEMRGETDILETILPRAERIYQWISSTTGAPEKPQSSPAKEQEKPKSSIDLKWVTTSLKKLQDANLPSWSNENVASYLNTLTGLKNTSLFSAFKNLDEKQATEFIEFIKEALKKLPDNDVPF